MKTSLGVRYEVSPFAGSVPAIPVGFWRQSVFFPAQLRQWLCPGGTGHRFCGDIPNTINYIKFLVMIFAKLADEGVGRLYMEINSEGTSLNYKRQLAVFAGINLLFTTVSFSHSRLSVTTATGAIPRLVPRNSSDGNKGDAASPCGAGSTTRGTNPVVLTVGETITADFEETIGHTGTFQLNFSQTGQVNFTTLAPAQTDDNTPVGATANKGKFTFTVPNTPCTDCTIQFVQDMSGMNNYKSCVDVIITPANTPPPAQPAGFAVTK